MRFVQFLTLLLLVAGVTSIHESSPAAADTTLVVNSAADPGDGICDAAECTLREAMTAANASVGVRETIAFSIGSGPHTILVGAGGSSDLPDISDPVTIDATTQPGFTGAPIIELTPAPDIGNSVPDGFMIVSGASVIRGFAINNFNGYGIWINGGPGGNVIQGNYLGFNLAGETNGDLLANTLGDVEIDGAPGNAIGGAGAGARNVIARRVRIGGIGATGNSLAGNYIATDPTGLNPVPFGGSEVVLVDADADGTTIGMPGAGNVVGSNIRLYSSGNVLQGNNFGVNANGTAVFHLSGGWSTGLVQISGDGNQVGGTGAGEGNLVGGYAVGMTIGGDNNLVYGNHFGIDGAEVVDLGSDGPALVVSGSSNTIGGVSPGQRNVIAFNGSSSSQGGLQVNTGTGNTIRGNSIYSNLFGGIRLLNGGNLQVPAPLITSTQPTAGTGCPGCTIDVYSDASDEGRWYEGTAMADGSGNWTFGGPVRGPSVTATATDAAGNTSEFSVPAACADFDADQTCDSADADDDNDGYTDVAEGGTPLCGNGINEDGIGGASDDGVADDGCPGGPPQTGAFSEAQFKIGTNVFGPCGQGAEAENYIPSGSWPSDLWSGGIPNSTDKITVQDITAFLVIVRRLGSSPGNPVFNMRWDLVPGPGLFGSWINVADMTALLAGPSGYPPMFGGAKAFGGPTCTGP